MSFSPVFCLFRGVELPVDTDIRDNLEAFFDSRPELFRNYEPYSKDRPLTFEDVYDEWHDCGYLIDSEFLNGVYLGETLYSCGGDSHSNAHEITQAQLANLDRKNWANLPDEVAEFILKYYANDIKIWNILYYI